MPDPIVPIVPFEAPCCVHERRIGRTIHDSPSCFVRCQQTWWYRITFCSAAPAAEAPGNMARYLGRRQEQRVRNHYSVFSANFAVPDCIPLLNSSCSLKLVFAQIVLQISSTFSRAFSAFFWVAYSCQGARRISPIFSS